MSKENDRSEHSWHDQNESEAPRSFREAYLNAVNPRRPRPRASNVPQQEAPESLDRPPGRARARNTPGSGRIYEEGDERSARPRPTKQSREEVYARLRQRPRQPIYTRDQDETRSGPPRANNQRRPPARRASAETYPPHQEGERVDPRAPRAWATDDADSLRSRVVEYDAYEVSESVRRTKRMPTHPRRRTGRRVLSTMLAGCLGGIITLVVVAAIIGFLVLHNTPLGQNLGVGKSTYTHSDQQALALGNATQLIVKSQAGNILVHTDRSSGNVSVASLKKVQASSQEEANNRFRSLVLITRQISRGADPSCIATICLLISTTTPARSTSGPFGGSNGDTVDLSLTLPESFSNPVSPSLLTVSTNAGNIAVNGFNGILNLNSIAGNINVAHNAIIFAGTCIQTTHGNVTIAQGSFFDPNQPSNLVPCKNTTNANPHPWFSINSGVGNVTIALRSDNTDLVLDALAIKGKIRDSFGPEIPTTSDGSSAYHGALLPNTNPVASLYIIASTGDITISKQ